MNTTGSPPRRQPIRGPSWKFAQVETQNAAMSSGYTIGGGNERRDATNIAAIKQ
ncbi:hypothetical protein [Crateriforma spongiae]|uniref:hypothetical protein n=1 Tax=Crateriforma spongiae TaxID=2724528 RepID=UPI001445920A|nr:hypothetical protein [Crateriforma spongiae]